MSKRSLDKQRARSQDDKALRREHLLRAAEAMLDEMPYESLTLSEVAFAAGLSKASAYTYFPTKESLFLALLEQRLGYWSDRLAERIGKRVRSPRSLARVVAESLESEVLMRSLLGRLHSALEANVPDAEILAFKRFLGELVARCGALAEIAVPALPPGAGERLMLLTYALVVGLGTLADRSENVSRALEADPALAARFEIDFATELASVLETVVAAWSARPAG